MSASIKESLGLDKAEGSVSTKKSKSEQAPSLRLELTLDQPTADSFPEFSYARLVEKELSGKKENGDPLVEDSEQQKLADIARRLEQKYGGGKTKKRKRLVYEEDLIDISSGYDESDSFVDNSEAFDEYVPEGYEPQHGGFYINDGDLFFKTIADDDDSRSMPAAGSDDRRDFASPKKVKHPAKHTDGERPGRGRGRGSSLTHKNLHKSPAKRPDGPAPQRGRPRKITAIKLSGPKMPSSVTATSALPTSSSQPASTALPVVAVGSAPATPTTPSFASTAIASDGRQPIAQKKLTMPSPSKSPERRSSSSQDEDDNGAGATRLTSASSTGTDDSIKFEHPAGTTPDEAMSFGDDMSNAAEVTELPDGLPMDLVDYIQKFKRDIQNHTIETACVKNLDSSYDPFLLEIETKLHNRVKGKKRQAVYAYLSSFLPHSKDALQRRAKKVNIANEEAMLEEPLARLHASVHLQMPEQQERYKEEVRRAVEAHNLKKSTSSDEATATTSDSTAGSGGEDDGDSSLIASLGSPTKAEESKPKKFRPPMKKFLWNNETRKLLCDAVAAKVEALRATMQRIVGGVESIKQFLEQRVKPIWPDSWMNVSILLRESRSAHLKITNPPQYKQLQSVHKANRGPKPGSVRKIKTAPVGILLSGKTIVGSGPSKSQPLLPQSSSGSSNGGSHSLPGQNSVPNGMPPLQSDSPARGASSPTELSSPPAKVQSPTHAAADKFHRVTSPTAKLHSRVMSPPHKMTSPSPKVMSPPAKPGAHMMKVTAQSASLIPPLVKTLSVAITRESHTGVTSPPKAVASAVTPPVKRTSTVSRSLLASRPSSSMGRPASGSAPASVASTPKTARSGSGQRSIAMKSESMGKRQFPATAAKPKQATAVSASKPAGVLSRKAPVTASARGSVSSSPASSAGPQFVQKSKSTSDLNIGSPPRDASNIMATAMPRMVLSKSAFQKSPTDTSLPYHISQPVLPSQLLPTASNNNAGAVTAGTKPVRRTSSGKPHSEQAVSSQTLRLATSPPSTSAAVVAPSQRSGVSRPTSSAFIQSKLDGTGLPLLASPTHRNQANVTASAHDTRYQARPNSGQQQQPH